MIFRIEEKFKKVTERIDNLLLEVWEHEKRLKRLEDKKCQK